MGKMKFMQKKIIKHASAHSSMKQRSDLLASILKSVNITPTNPTVMRGGTETFDNFSFHLLEATRRLNIFLQRKLNFFFLAPFAFSSKTARKVDKMNY